MVESRPLLAGVDIGSTMVRVVLAEVAGPELDVIGVGSAPSLGVRHGVVVDADRLGSALRQAVEGARMASGVEIQDVTVSISGEHVDALQSQGAVAVEGRDATVTSVDRQRAVDAARTVAIPFEREILHVLPRDFQVDEQRRIHNPTGMTGVRLGARVHIVTGGVTAVRNLVACVERSGFRVADLVFSPLASAKACLTEDELDMGVGLIDIGGGTTDVVCFEDGAIMRSCVVPLGGQQVTGDLAVCLRTTWSHAETLKRQYAASVEDVLQVASIAGRTPERVSNADVGEITSARLEEIFEHVTARLELTDSTRPRAGFVLTGGSCQLPSIATVAEETLGTATRIATPVARPGVGDTLAQPEWATAMGLVLSANDTRTAESSELTTRFDSAAGRMRSWLENLL
ncbi:MAG: cell division protein FtsA [Gemmatimonadetes bacterium]|jgi:cell division protein FtsA|nr:cell division protein FtsA [Gemmatimonadota bacterium]MBT7859693.1 cell division protein FtsA [Gemmatimonadota bacterium]